MSFTAEEIFKLGFRDGLQEDVIPPAGLSAEELDNYYNPGVEAGRRERKRREVSVDALAELAWQEPKKP